MIITSSRRSDAVQILDEGLHSIRLGALGRGATRVPAVHEMLSTMFRQPLREPNHAERLVAMGAA